MKTMFITVGTGATRKDIAGAIVKSIENQNPNKVIFVLSQKTREETLPEIKVRVGSGYESDELILKDIEDIKEISGAIVGAIKSEQRIKDNVIVADYTSGTKPMSAGLVLAAVQCNVPSLIFIHGKRDDGGRVIPGTENVTSYSLDEFYAKLAFREAINFFNEKAFYPSLKLVEGISCGSELFKHDVVQMRTLAEAFYK